LEGQDWRPRRFGGEAPQGARGENRRLKKLLAEQVLDNAALTDLLGKNF
jgi:hypothetical protein